MSEDATEAIRREMLAKGQPAFDLAMTDGPTWDSEALDREFEVLRFRAPFVEVRRLSDGKLGSLEFTHAPRVYFNWEEYKG